MTNSEMAKAACLCGSVKMTFPLEKKVFDACHCGMCRKWSGGPLMTVEAGSHINFEGKDSISIYNSSAWAERGFCKNCGTHLFYRVKESQVCFVPVGLIEGSEKFNFHMQIFVDRKPDSYNFVEKTGQMTEAEVFAMFAPKGQP